MNILVTESEVKCTIKVLKNKNSSGYCGISNRITKVGCDLISKPLVYIVYMSLTQPIFPNWLKYSIIKTSHKNWDKKQILNFRPVSLLKGFFKSHGNCIISKIKAISRDV